jgi:cytochrome b subunit of formate dehydrogenase
LFLPEISLMIRILAVLTFLLIRAGSAAAAEESCAQCHEQTKKIVGGVHASLGCDSCHVGHEEYPHPAKSEKPKCADCHEDVVKQHAASVHGQEIRKGNAAAPNCTTCHNDVHEVKSAKSPEWRKAVPDTCGMCHDQVAAQFKASVHGKGLANGAPEVPSCNDCHGEHNIQRVSNTQSPVHASHIRETCGSCHADTRLARKFHLPNDRLTSFDQSFHGLAMRAGNQTVANCASCHGIHNILPSTEAASTIHPSKLQQTCGQANCHPGTSKRFAIGRVHWVEGRNEPMPVQFVRNAYLFLIPVTIGLMLLHNSGDFVRKVRRLRFAGAAHSAAERHPSPVIRMYRFEKIQHILLLTSFITLLWTGFALKYPDAWWAQPLTMWETRWPVRGVVHRVASVIFVIVAIMHAISLLVNRRLRDHWKNLLPKFRDLPDAMHSMAYNLGLSKRKPKLPAYNFIEKAEYWAVVWGAIIMAGTGIMLWANTWFLRYVPKVWIDVATSIHLYEAILAGLAILVWHIYFVVLDPEVYPLETAFITGKSVRPHDHPEDEPSQA